MDYIQVNQTIIRLIYFFLFRNMFHAFVKYTSYLFTALLNEIYSGFPSSLEARIGQKITVLRRNNRIVHRPHSCSIYKSSKYENVPRGDQNISENTSESLKHNCSVFWFYVRAAEHCADLNEFSVLSKRTVTKTCTHGHTSPLQIIMHLSIRLELFEDFLQKNN